VLETWRAGRTIDDVSGRVKVRYAGTGQVRT